MMAKIEMYSIDSVDSLLILLREIDGFTCSLYLIESPDGTKRAGFTDWNDTQEYVKKSLGVLYPEYHKKFL